MDEARRLLNARCYGGAYYLAGLAVECALKACIAKQTRRHDFPELDAVKESWHHNLGKLVKRAGLDVHLKQDQKKDARLSQNWAIVKDWDNEARYHVNISTARARDLYRAVVARRSGVLQWLRRHW